MSSYPVPPPGYGTTNAQQGRNEVHEPLLGRSSRDEPGGFYDQPAPGELPDDFKACLLQGSSLSISHLFRSMASLSQRALLKSGMHSSAKSTRFSVSNSSSLKVTTLTVYLHTLQCAKLYVNSLSSYSADLTLIDLGSNVYCRWLHFPVGIGYLLGSDTVSSLSLN